LTAAVRRQVILYLRELSGRGVRFTLLSLKERSASFSMAQPAQGTQRTTAQDKMSGMVALSPDPFLTGDMFDVGARSVGQATRSQKSDRFGHARSYIPATIALTLERAFRSQVT